MSLALEKFQHEGTEIEFCGEALVADQHGCLYWPAEQLLIVSDLHLEKGSSFAEQRGTFLPPYDTKATLEQLAIRITDYQPKTVISLGDSFHDIQASERLPRSYRLALLQLMENRDWIWVSGNHDPQPPADLGGTFCTELQIGPLNFKHEPEVKFRLGEIAGHLHPAAKIRQRGKSIRKKCIASDGKRLILPAFGSFTGSLNVQDQAYDNLLEEEGLEVWLLGRDRVYRISGQQLLP